ncbi:hypothetical protein [Pseudolysinimonas sp.]|uniref:hypothetical protein n=1 Tax=Pseudolysinimonas sp. TaxID=2680009 RepID=UPI003F809EBC
MTTNHLIDSTDDAEEAVRILRAELRAARRRRALLRAVAAREAFSGLPLTPLGAIPDRGPRP